MILSRIISVIIGYVFGLFQTSYILGKIKGIDIRNYGSGNAGMTNTLRVLGPKAGTIVFIGDFMKAFICCTIIRFVAMYNMPDMVGVLVLYAGLGVVLGHNYPVHMGFKGGKGVASTAGVIVAIGDWRIVAINLTIFLVVTFASKYMSLGSLTVVTTTFISIIIFGQFDKVGFPGWEVKPDHLIEVYIMMFIFVASCYFMHRENIKRLATGTERKIGEKKEV